MTDARRPDDGATEPTRFCEDARATSLERALLRAGQGGAMPAMEKHRVWAAIAGQLVAPPSGPSPAPGGAGAASGAAGAGVLKGISVVALVASSAGLWAYQTHDMTTSPVAPAVSGSPSATIVAAPAEVRVAAPAEVRVAAPAEVVAPASVVNDVAPPEHAPSANRAAPARADVAASQEATRPGTAPAHKASATNAPSGAATAAAVGAPLSSSEPPPAPESRLSDEAHAVLAARAALRSGNPAAALRELSDARALFPRGALVQEREALTIEALARTGQSGAASARAQAFLHRFPRSPHADDVRRFVLAQ